MDKIRSESQVRADHPVALMFPGQGSQAVGMGREFLASQDEARRTFEEADQLLGWSLSRLCLDGPESELRRTEKAQPALFVMGVAAFRVLQSMVSFRPAACLGHSLGEYTALVAAGSITYATGLHCVRRRGEFMAAAMKNGEGGMAAVLGLEIEPVQTVCQESGQQGVLVVANCNAPGQVVISGHRHAIEAAIPILKKAGAKDVVWLKVSAPFHSPLMKDAADQLREVLASAQIQTPQCPVLSNVTGCPHQDPDTIRERLFDQVVAPVRWEQCVRWVLQQGIRDFLEMGPGRILVGLVRRIDRSSRVTAIEQPQAISTWRASLGAH